MRRNIVRFSTRQSGTRGSLLSLFKSCCAVVCPVNEERNIDIRAVAVVAVALLLLLFASLVSAAKQPHEPLSF